MRLFRPVVLSLAGLWGCSRQVDLGDAPDGGVEMAVDAARDPAAEFRAQLAGRWEGTARVFRATVESEVAIVMTFDELGNYTADCTSLGQGSACLISFGAEGSLTELTTAGDARAILAFEEQVAVDGELIADAEVTWDPATMHQDAQELELWRVWRAPRDPVSQWFARQVEARWTEAISRWLGEPIMPAQPDVDAGGMPVDAGQSDAAPLIAVAHVVLTRVP